MGTGLEFAILGPLEVRAGGELVHVGGPRQRALLGLLLCHANRVVSRDELIEELLAGQAAESADRMLRVQITRLRQALATGTSPVSYLGSLLFPADDLVLCLFCGPSRAAVIQASDQLGIPTERLMDSTWLPPHQHRPEGTRQ